MASLTGQTIASSYEQLLHTDTDGGGNGNNLLSIKDGDNGTTFALKLATNKVEVIPGSDDANAFEVSKADGTPVLTVDSTNARVGIGVSPDSRLHIKSAGNSSYPFKITNSANTNILAGIYQDAGGDSLLALNISDGTQKVKLLADGDSYFNGGNVLIGRTSVGSTGNGHSIRGADSAIFSRDGGEAVIMNRDTSDGTILEFRKDGTPVGTISTNANSLPSDRNFKRDISDLDIGLNFVNDLKPSYYNHKIDDADSPKMMGLIAQDVEQSLIDSGVAKNSTWLLQHEPVEDEKESDYHLDYVKLVPVLIKAIQELSAQNDALTARIEALENA